MEPIPDYSQYSWSELYEAQHKINKEEYPNKYASLMQEIGERQARQSNPTPQKSSTVVFAVFAFFFACVGLYWGGLALIMIIGHLMPLAPGARNDFSPWFGVLIGCVLLFMALVCFVPAIAFLNRKRN